MKRFLLVLATLFLITSSLATSVAEVKKRGVLVMNGYPDYDFQPFEFRGVDRRVQGFDIDVARAFAKDLGVKLQIHDISGQSRSNTSELPDMVLGPVVNNYPSSSYFPSSSSAYSGVAPCIAE